MNDPAVSSTLSRLLDEALDLPREERIRWVDTIDPTHDGLKPRLRALLERAAEVESRDFLNRLPPLEDSEAEDDGADAPRAEAAGARVGPYRLERQIGSGGMGTVWLATRADGLFERSIALKLPHRGMFGADLAERMARERSILAGLDHPNIARLYDAGLTNDGQPYLALEYVEGLPVDEYCRRNNCDLRARLRLFLQVANAVASAHARLVVHRDLKPANILVTADGNVRLLDFGIAKLLDTAAAGGESPLTQVSGSALTPDYASPEQILGQPVTIASDVYSLGVVLYELLTGERPYRLRRDTRGALEDAILQVEPRRPSDVAAASARDLRGDLDTIVLKALRKPALERYATVNAFAEDIERFLEGRPVLARPDSAWYRTSRFVRRHKLGVGIAASVTLAILTTAAVALWQARVAIAERQRAEEVKQFIASIFTGADPYEGGGRQLSAIDLLKQARNRIDRDFAARPELRVELLNTVTSSLSNLSDYEAADDVSAVALDVATRELPPASALRREARIVRLELHRFQGRTVQLRSEVDALLAEASNDPSFSAGDRVRLYLYSAHAAIDEGRGDVAETMSGQAADLAARELSEQHALTMEAAVVQAVSLRYAGKPELAERAAERALRLTLAAFDDNPANARVLDARMALGSAYNDTGKPALAAKELEAALAGAQKLYGPGSAFELYASSHLARAYAESGELRAALVRIDHALELTAKQADEESRNRAIATGIRSHILLAAGNPAGALAGFDAALPIYRESIGAEHDATYAIRVERALALARLGRYDAALAELRDIVARKPQVAHWMVVSPIYSLGLAERIAGRADQGLALQREALAKVIAGPRSQLHRMAILSELGQCALQLGALDEAGSALRESLALHSSAETVATPARADVLLALGRVQLARGAHEEAVALLTQADAFWRDFDPKSPAAREAARWLRRSLDKRSS